MRPFLRRRAGVPAEVLAAASLPPGERVLAHAPTRDGRHLLGTRRRLVIVDAEPVPIPWERVEDAGWDSEEAVLRVTEIGEYGTPRPTHVLPLEDQALFLQLVRERVSASVVLQRRVVVRGRLGVTVIGRRSPAGGQVQWMHAYDPGLDPADPDVAKVAEQALAEARREVGDTASDPI